MHEQLKNILLSIKSSKNYDQEIGKVIDILRSISYFKDLDDQFGAEYLVMCLPLINVLVLRKGQTLIDQCDHYVLMDGDLRAEALTSGSRRQISLGTLIDLKEEHLQSFVANVDCYLIRIKKGVQMQSHYKILLQKEKECLRLFRQNQKHLTQQKQSYKQQLFIKVPFFNCLSKFDFIDLIIKSSVKEYSQSYITHLNGKEITKIGCIVSGKIKLAFSMDESLDRRARDREMQWNLSEGDWIGLEEHLGGEPMKSSGQVDSVTAVLVWIPNYVFNSKFNVKTNYQVINRLMNLMQKKREMFQKSFNCIKKQYQLSKDNDRSMDGIKGELEKKISGLDSKTRHRRSFHRAKFTREFDIPSNIIHKVTNFLEIIPTSSLPKLKQKVVLFPEEYAASLVNPSLQRELIRLENNKNRNHRSSSVNNRSIDSPQKLYKTIYSKIAFQFQTAQQYAFTKEKTPKKASHYNFSIYNNFRVNKDFRIKEDQSQRMKSLAVLPNATQMN